MRCANELNGRARRNQSWVGPDAAGHRGKVDQGPEVKNILGTLSNPVLTDTLHRAANWSQSWAVPVQAEVAVNPDQGIETQQGMERWKLTIRSLAFR